jgi:hypothetical protein
VAQGKLGEALKAYQEDLAIRDRLTKIDPDNAGWQYDLYWRSVSFWAMRSLAWNEMTTPRPFTEKRWL